MSEQYLWKIKLRNTPKIEKQNKTNKRKKHLGYISEVFCGTKKPDTYSTSSKQSKLTNVGRSQDSKVTSGV